MRSSDRDGEVDFAFSVLPRWSRAAWARFGYAALAALAVAGWVIWRLVRVRRENIRLEAHIARQTGELVLARATAESANGAKDAFLANMSHELRTPLNAVLGYAQIMLTDAEVTPRNRERLGVIVRSGEHLLAMMNEVLDLSKMEAGKFTLDPVDFYLTSALDAAAETLRARATGKGIGFSVHCAPDLPVIVRGDERRLRQVLLNLLGNAVKFTTRGAVRFRVTRVPENGVRFEVTDTGVGIAADELDKVFSPFQQARNLDAIRDTGLGLAIAQRLVGRLGGELRAESTLGVGSRFWFELPLPEVAMERAALPALPRASTISKCTRDTVAPPSATNGHQTVTPPDGELDVLLELSRRGDVLKIRRRLADLLAADPRHACFVEPLAALAANYQMHRLRDALLEKMKAAQPQWTRMRV